MARRIVHPRLQIWTMISILAMKSFVMVAPLAIVVQQEECVNEYVLYEGDMVSGNFVVVDHDIFWPSDHPGIDFTVTSPAGNVVLDVKGTSGEKFEFRSPRFGMYKFCFKTPDNPYSTPETVAFHIHVGHIPEVKDVAKHEHMHHINVKIAELRESLESVVSEQKYLKARGYRHQRTNESTKKRVILYAVGEYVVLVGVSSLQVVYIRRLFSNSAAYNRV